MSSKFTRVVRYRCEWCGREFRTDRLHDCKFDPDKRNCLSCRHQIGDFDVREDDGWAGVETFKARRLALLDKENARAKEDFPWL